MPSALTWNRRRPADVDPALGLLRRARNRAHQAGGSQAHLEQSHFKHTGRFPNANKHSFACSSQSGHKQRHLTKNKSMAFCVQTIEFLKVVLLKGRDTNTESPTTIDAGRAVMQVWASLTPTVVAASRQPG